MTVETLRRHLAADENALNAFKARNRAAHDRLRAYRANYVSSYSLNLATRWLTSSQALAGLGHRAALAIKLCAMRSELWVFVYKWCQDRQSRQLGDRY